jgi:hypothetical protein
MLRDTEIHGAELRLPVKRHAASTLGSLLSSIVRLKLLRGSFEALRNTD